jgi:NAD(P)-dependent dehydrogenase (short-subunit alcohol dehydrogenase family)
MSDGIWRKATDLETLSGWIDSQGLGMGPITKPHLLAGDIQNIILMFEREGCGFVPRRASGHSRSAANGTVRQEVAHPRLTAASRKATSRVITFVRANTAALNAMTIDLPQEHRPKVRLNAIAARPFLTDISRAWTDEKRRSAADAVGRPDRPKEMVASALYLASPHSRCVNGAILWSDGALHV